MPLRSLTLCLGLLGLLGWGAEVPACAQSASANTATNLAKSWPSLAEVRKRWDSQTVESVRQAAEGGELTAQHYLGFCYASGERVGLNPALALSWYQRAGDAGYLPSFNNMGALYYEGRVVTQDLAKAFSYYRRAATGGMAQAQANLGFAYRDGTGVEADPGEALKWFRLAADQGQTTAMVNVGRAYRFGQGVPKDAQAAIRWFEAADASGDPLGTVNLAWMYGYVSETPRDETKAYSLFQKAAERGQPDAMYELFLAYKNGRGVAADPQTATSWLVKAAEAGHAYAQSVRGRRFAEPIFDSDPEGRQPKNMPEAVRWYQLSAEQDCSRGQYYLGLCYIEGEGVEKDEEKGLDLIRRAADQDYSLAVYDLAGLYARGIGEPRSRGDQPLELFKRLVGITPKSLDGLTKGGYDAIVFRQQYGLGTERDLVAAADTYCQAAVEGAMGYSLADKLESPVPRSKIEGGGSFTSSAELSSIAVRQPELQGMNDEFLSVLRTYVRASRLDPAALAEIGDRYLTGRDVPRSQTNAWLWLTLAQQNGATEARSRTAAIEQHVTAEDKQEMTRYLPVLMQKLQEIARAAREESSSRTR
jgi:uncharacterized protein